MAAPGLGVGDIVNACNYIYIKCMQYKDAVKEFDEIASKAKSTTVVIKRLEDEALLCGNLVERAGIVAYEQLEDNLQILREDALKLKELMVKYEKIHDIIGRRILFAFKESDNLTDLRRRIGLHERTLELWYNSLVYSSLRRIENGQKRIEDGVDDIFSAIKSMDRKTAAKVMAEVERGNVAPLQDELRKRGVSREAAQTYSSLSSSYLTASNPERTRIERMSRDRTRTMSGEGTFFPTSDEFYRPDEFAWDRRRPTRSPPSEVNHRMRRDLDRQRQRNAELHHREDDIPTMHIERQRSTSDAATRPRNPFPMALPQPVDLNDPFLGLPQLNLRGRRASYHGRQHSPEGEYLQIRDNGRSLSRTRNKDRSTSRGGREPGSHSRNASNHSYHRRRRSADGDPLDAEDRHIRMVQRMDRIDSMDTQDDSSGRR